MGIVSQFSIATQSYGRALRLFGSGKISWYLFVPILLNVALLGLVVWFSIVAGAGIVDWVYDFFGIEQTDWTGVVAFLLGWTIRLLIFLVYFAIYKYLILVLLSPFLSLLSEAVDTLETGREFRFSWSQLARDVWRAVLINLQNFIVEMLLTFLLSLLAFVPFVGLLSPFVILLVQSYFFGFALMDYSPERYRFPSRVTRSWMRKNMWTVSGVGLAFYGCFLIPFVGWVIAPVWATVAGTLAFLKVEKEKPANSSFLLFYRQD
jgi:CysZ protein